MPLSVGLPLVIIATETPVDMKKHKESHGYHPFKLADEGKDSKMCMLSLM